MRMRFCAILALALLGVSGTANAWGIPSGVPTTCSDDKGVGELFKQMNVMLFNSYVSAEDARANAIEATGNKEEGEKIRAQTKDLNAEQGPKDAQKAAAESIASTQKILEDFEKTSTELDARGKELIALARKSSTKANLFVTVASLISAPITVSAKEAIAANSVCATSLNPAVQSVGNLVDTAKAVDAGNKVIGEFAKKRGLPDLTADEKKSMVDDMKLPPDIASKLSF